MAKIVNITIDQGTDFRQQLFFKAPNGTPLDITGYEFKSEVRKKFKQAEPDFVFEFEILDQTNEQTRGYVWWKLARSVTDALTLQEKDNFYLYDIEQKNPAGLISRIVQGKITIDPQVTKAT